MLEISWTFSSHLTCIYLALSLFISATLIIVMLLSRITCIYSYSYYMKVRVMCRKFECCENIHYIYTTQTWTMQLRKMQLQGLPAGNGAPVLWNTRPVLYHRATESVADNFARVQDIHYCSPLNPPESPDPKRCINVRKQR